MKFRFILVTEDGEVFGLNNIQQAQELSEKYEFLVVDIVTGQILNNSQPLPGWNEIEVK